jgi:hypothetical protein
MQQSCVVPLQILFSKFTQLLGEINISNLLQRKERPARNANLTAICESIVNKKREPRLLTTLWASMAYYKESFTYV